MLHVTCDIIGIAQYHFLNPRWQPCILYFIKIFSFFSQFVLENVRNRTKTVLVTLIALNTRNSSKIVVIVYELMLRLYTEFSLTKHAL